MPGTPTDRRPGLTGRELLGALGPGLLWAGSAIGVSHLVQSTRAGAAAGLGLAGVILAALVLKYPFFDFGPRYAAATRESLVEGYARIGRWALWLYFGLTLATGVVVDAAILLLTAFLVRVTLGLTWPIAIVAALLYAASAGLIAVGRYRLLDASMKVILAALAASTLVAAGVALPAVDASTLAILPRVGSGAVSFGFLLALVGWMPTAIDLSVWSSLWTLASDRSRGEITSVAAARADFLIGYAGTGVLALAFLVLGAGVLYGTGVEFSDQGGAFSLQLVDLYASTLGAWTRPLVLVAVLTTMLSTTLTVVDGFPRALERTQLALSDRSRDGGRVAEPGSADALDRGGGRRYWGWVVLFGVSTTLVMIWFVGSLTTMADFATTLSFLTAPVLGYLNLRVIRSAVVPLRHRPGRALVALAWIGIASMAGFGATYLGWLLVR